MANRLHYWLLIIPPVLFAAFLTLRPQTSYANLLEDALDGLNQLVNPKKAEVSLESTVTLKDNEFGDPDTIDAGDTVTFSFTLTNTTDQEYPFATLDTGIPRDTLHFIHNVVGTTGLTETNNSIQLVNLILMPGQSTTISFDAHLNYAFDQDFDLSFTPKFKAKDNQVVTEAKETKQAVKALKEKDKQKFQQPDNEAVGITL